MLAKKTTQLNLRIRKDWLEELTNLSKQASSRYEKEVSVQTLIRESICIAYEELAQRCELHEAIYK